MASEKRLKSLDINNTNKTRTQHRAWQHLCPLCVYFKPSVWSNAVGI